MPPRSLDRFKGFVGQYKYDDIRVVIHFAPGRDIELLTRRLEPVREYRLTPGMTEALRGLKLDPSKTHVLDGGIIRHLVIRRESPVVLWDILVHDDNYLLDTTYESRYELLREICGFPEELEKFTGHQIGLQVRGMLWLAPTFTEALPERFQRIRDYPYIEGLLLKNARAKLEPGFREANNTRWQIKFRKPKKHYMY